MTEVRQPGSAVCLATFRIALTLAVLALPGLCLAEKQPALDARVRIGFEAGAAWFNAFPDEALGPTGLVRARVQLTDRILLNAAVARLDQPWTDGRRLRTTLAPLTLDLRLDRAPIAPYIGGGVAAVHVEGLGTDWGGVFEAGFEWQISHRWAISTQATYAGIGAAPDTFPFFSSLTAGLSCGL